MRHIVLRDPLQTFGTHQGDPSQKQGCFKTSVFLQSTKI